mgnify:FL=1
MSELLNSIRSRIKSLGIDFQFTGTVRTRVNGTERETWLLEYEGSQFIFVPGQKHVTLGWDTDRCPLGDGVLEGLRKEFALGHRHYQKEMEDMKAYYERQIIKAETNGDAVKGDRLRREQEEDLKNLEEEMKEGGYESWGDFMRKWKEHLSRCLSPLRTADIGDLIVEVDSRYLEEDAPSLEQAVLLLKEGPFTLATEDEWEYLCNGGTRTLFRWGDTLSGVMTEIYNVGAVSDAREKLILEQPNMLGLYIAYDSYKKEIIDNVQYTKGGDGGGSLCGGDGVIHVLPCYTAFYRQPAAEHGCGLSKHYYCYRRIVRLP